MAVPAVSAYGPLHDKPKSGPHPHPPSPSTSSESSWDELRACPIGTAMSSGDSNSPLQHKELRSTYHLYHDIKRRHQQISPLVSKTKERVFGPKPKELRALRRESKLLKKEREASSDNIGKHLTKATTVQTDDDSFFLHNPYLAFHEPPRVLYTGSTKSADPVILIHSSLFWRTWKLQLGPSIAEPGVIDPRGVVSWRHNGGNHKALKADGRKLKGYKVRTWRLWGETGKRYVHAVKAARKAGRKEDDPDVIQQPQTSTDATIKSTSEKEARIVADQVRTSPAPVRADDVVYLVWSSPLSRDPRRYHFQYCGIEFAWKGTGTVKETRACGMWLKYNHLKLVVRLPISENTKSESGMMEVCLAKFTSSLAKFKSGVLETYDAAIWQLLKDYLPRQIPEDQDTRKVDEKQNMNDQHVSVHSTEEGDEATIVKQQIRAVKKTQLYQVIVATAMCMIIGEKEKRETIRRIIELLASEGGGAAGN